MCGRTHLSLTKDQLRCACSYKPKGKDFYEKPQWLDEHNNGKEYKPSYNIAPTDVTPVMVSQSKFKNAAETEIVLKPMMWGVIPPWHKGDFRSHNLSTNNCRLENLQESKLYGPLLKKGGRCIIIVNGYYEWKTTDKSSKVKQPYYIYSHQPHVTKIDEPDTWEYTSSLSDGWKGVKLLYMAGVYNIWQNEDIVMYSYSVITMESNSTLDWLHHRMPAILDSQEQINAWLDIDNVDPERALQFLRPVKSILWHPVSTQVNNSKIKSMECNKRVSVQKNMQKSITSWFTKAEKRKSVDENVSEAKRNKI